MTGWIKISGAMRMTGLFLQSLEERIEEAHRDGLSKTYLVNAPCDDYSVCLWK
ncbi:MAG: hypothetical protein HW387_1708 [Parachlamydiales bacterium]|nr:hypothetical protein [Parachlamydiales bacterium]